MVGEAHGQTLEAALSQQLIAIQELNDKIVQLGKRNKPQGRRPQHEERRFGSIFIVIYNYDIEFIIFVYGLASFIAAKIQCCFH